MQHRLISHNPDLKHLRDEGFEVEVLSGYLVVRNVPYVNTKKEIKNGDLVSVLELAGDRTVKPAQHVIHFMGEYPCNKDGSPIEQIRNASTDQKLADGVLINHSFSNRPKNGYDDYYHKVTQYVEIISAPAVSLDPSVTAKTFRPVSDTAEDSVFQYMDTNSSRANIGVMNGKFKGQKVAIVGLGGTGSYILDLVAKTPVAGIHLIDGDEFLQHNAFRSPGAPSLEQLGERRKKVDYYASIYGRMHKGIVPHPTHLLAENIGMVGEMSFVFICIDSNSARKVIMDYLLAKGIPFIDVGLGVNTVDDQLIGTLRVTAGFPSKSDHLHARVPTEDAGNNEYGTNIQIADLNALNANLAVIKWKKASGFYQDLEGEHHCTYSINVAQLLNEDLAA